MASHHELLDGKLQVYLRGKGRFWQCSASVAGKQWRTTTKQVNRIHPVNAAASGLPDLRVSTRLF